MRCELKVGRKMGLQFRSILSSLSSRRNSSTGQRPTVSELAQGSRLETSPVVDRSSSADASNAGSDWAKEILDLLELELGAMIRQLERAANSVASGAEATANRDRKSTRLNS